MDNLEHGWLLGSRLSEREFVGYCVDCDEPIYDSDDYDFLCGDVYCYHCAKNKHKELRGEI